MPVYRPTELKAFLESIGASPRKGLSQNFLIDGNIVRRIVDSIDPHKDDLIIEIGAGPGALTETLLELGCHVVAIEMDPLFAKALERLKSLPGRLDIVQKDALTVSLKEMLELFADSPGQKVKIIGNLPYHITTPLLERFIVCYPEVERIVCMVQEEVARRMTASPHTSEYSSLTLFLEFYAEASYEFKVGRNCFYPAPKVDSGVVKLLLREPPHVDTDVFFTLTRGAFGQRRKSLRSSLRKYHQPSEIEDALNKMGLAPLARPEELSIEQFLMLYQHLTS